MTPLMRTLSPALSFSIAASSSGALILMASVIYDLRFLVAASVFHGLDHERLYAFHGFGGLGQLKAAHVLGASTLRGYLYLYLAAFDNGSVYYGRGVVPGVDPLQRMADRLSQVAFLVALAHAFVDGVFQGAVQQNFPAYLNEKDRYAGVLAHGQMFPPGYLEVLDYLAEDFLAEHGLFLIKRRPYGRSDIRFEIAGR